MKSILLGIYLTFSADAATTHYALSSLKATEVVIPTQNPYFIDAIVMGEAVATTFSITWLDRNKHRKMARVIGWSIIVARGAVVAHNMNELRK